ncbi:hypothetical protein Pcac1_g16936 [Phytophthora cactorum]|nr:hypothetical protein Pcac1_g16936 [Phytophthora cactorum]
MEELAEASIEDTDGAGLQLDIALRRPEDKCVKSYYRRFNYTRAWASSRKIAYRCSRFRTGCRATMEFTIATMGYSAVRSHTCRAAVPAVGRLQDVTTAMMNRADTLAIEKVALPACLIWEALGDEFYGSGNGNVRLADVPRGRVRRAPRERIQLPVPVEITEDIADDSDEEEGTGFSV